MRRSLKMAINHHIVFYGFPVHLSTGEGEAGEIFAGEKTAFREDFRRPMLRLLALFGDIYRQYASRKKEGLVLSSPSPIWDALLTKKESAPIPIGFLWESARGAFFLLKESPSRIAYS
ncbi:MAG: hypothetical protein SOX25_08540 [Eubacteriales bacterium]|nr:hypothetical protein [Eubacteriales bacterium]